MGMSVTASKLALCKLFGFMIFSIAVSSQVALDHKETMCLETVVTVEACADLTQTKSLQ